MAVGLSDKDEWDRETHYEMLNHHGRKAVDFDLDEFIESGEIIIGTPNDVTEQLKRQYDQLNGFGTMYVGAQFGDLPFEKGNENHCRFVKEVVPALQAYTVETTESAAS